MLVNCIASDVYHQCDRLSRPSQHANQMKALVWSPNVCVVHIVMIMLRTSR